jgi:hypothetical protein
LRVSASISPWLPILKDFLPSLIVLGEKAAELYHLSLMGERVSPHRSKEAVFGIEKGGRSKQKLHDHLLKQGFHRTSQKMGADPTAYPCYSREDLGIIYFIFPRVRFEQKVLTRGLAAFPDKRLSLLMENPHFVDVPYLGIHYEVLLPQVGRYILDKGLQLSTGRFLNPVKIYESAQSLLIILDLLVTHDELQEETLNDFLEIRPPGLVKEFLRLLKENGPGSVIWESAQKLYLEKHPESKIVVLTKWYWEFIPYFARFLEKQKDFED